MLTDGNSRILIENNEGNRKNNAKTKKQLPTQKSMGYRLDFKISLLKMQPETHVFSKFAAPDKACSTEKIRVSGSIFRQFFAKFVLKLGFLVILRLRFF